MVGHAGSPTGDPAQPGELRHPGPGALGHHGAPASRRALAAVIGDGNSREITGSPPAAAAASAAKAAAPGERAEPAPYRGDASALPCARRLSGLCRPPRLAVRMNP